MATFDKVKSAWLQDPRVREGAARPEVFRQIAALIKQVREDSGLTQVEIQNAVGLAQSEISSLEKAAGGRTPGVGTMVSIGIATRKVLMISYLTPEQAAEIQERQNSGEELFRYSTLLGGG